MEYTPRGRHFLVINALGIGIRNPLPPPSKLISFAGQNFLGPVSRDEWLVRQYTRAIPFGHLENWVPGTFCPKVASHDKPKTRRSVGRLTVLLIMSCFLESDYLSS